MAKKTDALEVFSGNQLVLSKTIISETCSVSLLVCDM